MSIHETVREAILRLFGYVQRRDAEDGRKDAEDGVNKEKRAKKKKVYR